jgi:hypothetical protein
MATIPEIKEREVLDTPILLLDCTLHDGTLERWSTHELIVESQTYSARVLSHDMFSFRLGSDDGVDASARLSLRLANADSYFSQMERNIGFKGARLSCKFAFFDLTTGLPTSEWKSVFRGICTGIEEIREDDCKIGFSNLLNLQRMVLPTRRIQKTCPWVFPKTAEEREEALNGGDAGKYSLHYACGYSPDVVGGAGNAGPGGPYTSCSYTRQACEERGMMRQDALGQPTRRFGGVGFVPASTLVRGFGEKESRLVAALGNEGKYNEAVPLVYGTAWYAPPIVFARNDGNLTRMEILLGAGTVERVRTVVVNSVEIPASEAGKDMTGTGWHTLLSAGERSGVFNPDFAAPDGSPLGDPYGSTAYLSVVVPNAVAAGNRLPRVDVLIDGLRLPRYDTDGNYLGEFFSANPAWILLDMLRRSGWKAADLDFSSFAEAAAHCDELIDALDAEGNEILLPRYRCNFVLTKRRSVADLVRGVKSNAGLYFVYGDDGRVQLKPESAISIQQTDKPAGSNAQESLNGGWPAYEFCDGTYGFSGICRRPDGSPSLRLRSKPAGEVANRYSVEFQNEHHLYQQDTVSILDLDDIRRTGHEVASAFPVLGLPNAHQATRIMKRQLDRSLRGNLFVDFDTSVRGVNLRPGDIITVTYLKDGLNRTPFRILRIAPGLNYGTITITAQLHDDAWYSDTAERLGSVWVGTHGGLGTPRPIVGATVDADGFTALGLAEQVDTLSDGGAVIQLTADFVPPVQPRSLLAPPVAGLSPQVHSSGGTLPGGRRYYYAVTGLDVEGGETTPSVLIRADVPAGTNTNRVVLESLKWSPGITSLRVYRGPDPLHLLRIADAVAPSETYEDGGAAPAALPIPDDNYDSANLYWRYELQPPVNALIATPETVGNGSLSMTPGEFSARTVLVTEGRGRGQERTITSNSETTITVAQPWSIVPDGTSKFAVAEAGWRFAVATRSSPGLVEVPNREGLTVHVSARSRNAAGIECPAELAIVTRWQIGGSAGESLDANPPPAPFFAVAPTGRGGVEIVGVSFATLTDTRTVESGTITMFYWDELLAPSPTSLAGAISDSATTLLLTAAGTASQGDLIQLGQELMRVTQVTGGGAQYEVERGRFGTTAAAYDAGTPVFDLREKTFVLPFPREFFGSPASGSYSYTVPLSDARVAAAEMYVTNIKGMSPTSRNVYTGTVDNGMRTHSGSQYTLQVEGYLAIQSGATPPLTVSSTHSVRDVSARVATAPEGAPITLRVNLDGTPYCTLTIAPDAQLSDTVSGFNLRPLTAQSVLTLDIVSVGQAFGTTPGRDLTVTIRL